MIARCPIGWGAEDAVTVAKGSPVALPLRPVRHLHSATVPTDEPPGPVPRPPNTRLAWAARLVLLAAVLCTVMLAALLVAMHLNDSRIDGHRGVATATVLFVSPLRTGIEFVDATGVTIRPPGGVLYPGLLSIGQEFVVEYSTVDPTIVRVAGRTARVGIVMVVFAAMVTWLIATPIVVWFRRRSGLRLLARYRPLDTTTRITDGAQL